MVCRDSFCGDVCFANFGLGIEDKGAKLMSSHGMEATEEELMADKDGDEGMDV